MQTYTIAMFQEDTLSGVDLCSVWRIIMYLRIYLYIVTAFCIAHII